MNWILFLELLGTVTATYWMLFPFTGIVADFLKDFSTIHSKYVDTYWRWVTGYRFLWPVRKLMWVMWIPLYVFDWVDNSNPWNYIMLAVNFWYAFFVTDKHDDDPRQKKPSKVLSAIKSLGHRLVVVPQ